jgi:hypothetical protein
VVTIDHYSAVNNRILFEMASLENRAPKQNDTVTVAGRTGSFAVIGIDAMNKTVEVRATSAPFAVFTASWATISYTG